MFGMSVYIFANLFRLERRNLRNTKAKIAGQRDIVIYRCDTVGSVFNQISLSGKMRYLDFGIWNDKILEQAKERFEEKYCNGRIKLLHLELGDSKGNLLEYYAKINIDNIKNEPVIFTLYRSFAIKDVKINGTEYNEFVRIGLDYYTRSSGGRSGN